MHILINSELAKHLTSYGFSFFSSTTSVLTVITETVSQTLNKNNAWAMASNISKGFDRV